MSRQLCILLFVLSCFITGCTGFMGALVSAQEWSENYALLDGTTCTSSHMIDGNLETVGKAQRHWITVTLPTRKPIHRIVLRGTNIEDVIVYENLGGEGEWRRIEQIKNNRKSTIDMRVRVVTDSIRFKVGGTFDDKRIAGQYSYRTDAVRNRQIERGSPMAQEIELYGFTEKKSSSDE